MAELKQSGGVLVNAGPSLVASQVTDLTPRQIVAYLDEHIVGQTEAKKMVAIALRNRLRRQKLPKDLAREVTPKNILMVGPTGVGKTEIARRLAKLIRAPFVKVEATKFTEVGYVGRNVESMVRDLVAVAARMVREELIEKYRSEARSAAIDCMVDALVPSGKKESHATGIPTFLSFMNQTPPKEEPAPSQGGPSDATKAKMRRLVEEGKLDDREVEFELTLPAPETDESLENGFAIIDMMKMMNKTRTKKVKTTVAKGLEMLQVQEAEKLLDEDMVAEEAIKLAEETGIIFIDEIDKVANGSSHGADVSREGVQRDLLPIIEGCQVKTKYGVVNTDYILFIAAGAFAQAKPSDLVAELQGRLPLRVELTSLGADELTRILTEPRHSLVQQYQALLETEGVTVQFEPEALRRIAELAESANHSVENIGARRLHSLLEKLLEDVNYAAEDYCDQPYVIDVEKVETSLSKLVRDTDLNRYLL